MTNIIYKIQKPILAGALALASLAYPETFTAETPRQKISYTQEQSERSYQNPALTALEIEEAYFQQDYTETKNRFKKSFNELSTLVDSESSLEYLSETVKFYWDLKPATLESGLLETDITLNQALNEKKYDCNIISLLIQAYKPLIDKEFSTVLATKIKSDLGSAHVFIRYLENNKPVNFDPTYNEYLSSVDLKNILSENSRLLEIDENNLLSLHLMEIISNDRLKGTCSDDVMPKLVKVFESHGQYLESFMALSDFLKE
jgi:hypothetical protein